MKYIFTNSRSYQCIFLTNCVSYWAQPLPDLQKLLCTSYVSGETLCRFGESQSFFLVREHCPDYFQGHKSYRFNFFDMGRRNKNCNPKSTSPLPSLRMIETISDRKISYKIWTWTGSCALGNASYSLAFSTVIWCADLDLNFWSLMGVCDLGFWFHFISNSFFFPNPGVAALPENACCAQETPFLKNTNTQNRNMENWKTFTKKFCFSKNPA